MIPDGGALENVLHGRVLPSPVPGGGRGTAGGAGFR